MYILPHSLVLEVDQSNLEEDLHIIITSQPGPGGGPVQSGGGPPYFLCPVVTSRL